MSSNKRRLIILVVLVIILALIAFLLLSRRSGRVIAGGDFSFITSIYGFTTPLGVATDDQEDLWVSNTSKGEIIHYDRDGIEKGKIDAKDDKGETIRFYSPYGIAVDEARGKVYVCDFNWRGVRVFDKEGKFLYNLPKKVKRPGADGVMGTDDDDEGPEDIGLNPEFGFAPYGAATYGDQVFVASKDGIYVFSADDGSYIAHWGTRGDQAGQYDFPNSIAADQSNGNLYVADTLNRRVVALNPDGGVRWMLGVYSDEQGTVSSVIQLPRGIAVDPDGRIYVTDTFNHEVLVIDSDGKLLSAFGERGTADSQFSFPEGIAISPGYRMYIADRQNDRVQIWQLAGDLPRVDPDRVRNFESALTVVES